MRNKFKFLIFILSFIYVFINYSFSSEIFNFDVKEIEIIDNGNRFLGKKGGTAKTIDGLAISAENFDDFYIVIISESFIENKKDSIMASLNNLSEVASVKSIRIEP